MKTQNAARFAGVLAMLLLVSGIVILGFWIDSPPKIKMQYGQSGGRAVTSVNGTSVFARMFRQAGVKVRKGLRLSPRLARSDVIVWTPNSFELPSKDEIEFLEDEWLSLDDYRERTLVYVARDYEAAIEYWRQQAEAGEGSDYIESTRQRARMQAEHAYMRSLTGRKTDCKWFSIDNQQHFFPASPTEGAWSKDLNQDGFHLPVSGILKAPESDDDLFGLQSEVLLGAAETPLILEIRDEYNWPYGKILVVQNGSSILNYPLVNHENRKIASRMIDYCENASQVTFLESGPMGLPISQSNSNVYSGFEALTVWPINAILLHLIAAGILFCLMVFPVFGRPQELVTDRPNDFGKHVQAMQQLLELAGNRQLAINKVNQYRQLELDLNTTQQPKKTDSGNPFKVSQA